MAAPAKSLEAKATRGQAEHVAKPWLKTASASALRATERPSSVAHHLKAIAESSNQHFGEALERSKKSAHVVYATLHVEDDKAYKQSGTTRFSRDDPKLQYMSRMDYTSFLEAALDESQRSIASAPSLNMFDMRRTVERKVAWLPKLEDLYRSESQEPLPGDHLVHRMMTLTGPRLGTAPAGASSATAQASPAPHWKKVQQQMQSRGVVRVLGKASGATSKGLPRPGEAGTATADSCAGASERDAWGDVHATGHQPAAVLPWENPQLIARRGVRHDVLHDRLQTLSCRITRRRQAGHEPESKPGSWVRHSPRLSTVGAAAVVLSTSLHGGERIKVPTDGELLAMAPVEALRVLRECELRTMALLTGVKQTWKDRVKMCKGKRLVLLQGGGGIHQDEQLRSRYNSYLLEVLEKLTAKRRVVVRHVVSHMDSVAKDVGTEVAGVAMRKKRIDAEEAVQRQALRRQDEEDAALGRGYVAVRFADRPGTCPA